MQRAFMLMLSLALVTGACGGGDSTAATAATTTTLAPNTSTAPAPSTTTTTTVASTTTTTTTEASGIVPGQDPDVDAIVLAYTTALDSVSPYEEKEPFIDDPSGLEETVAQYLATGESMGGIGVAVTGVAVDGDTATVTYDLLFAGNPSYPNLTGEAVKTAGGWKITRAGFCSLMSSARVGCPS